MSLSKIGARRRSEAQVSDEVTLKLQACNQCPHMQSERHYTADSFEDVAAWKCMRDGGRTIALVDWNDKAPPIPEWCPLRGTQRLI